MGEPEKLAALYDPGGKPDLTSVKTSRNLRDENITIYLQRGYDYWVNWMNGLYFVVVEWASMYGACHMGWPSLRILKRNAT